jgi:hypothetical protein
LENTMTEINTEVGTVPVTEVVLETPAVLTKEEILNWSGAEMRKKMQESPELKAQIEAVMNAPIIDEAAVAEAQAEEDRIAAEAAVIVEAEAAAKAAAEADAKVKADAEAAAVEAEKARLAAEEAAKPKKIIKEYQVRDENGNPIGRPTHLEAATWEEMSQKQEIAHVQAVRYAERIKRQKLTFKQAQDTPVPLTEEQLLAEAAKLKSDDPAEALAASKKIFNAELEQERQQLALEKENARREREAFSFMKNHVTDYNPCQANAEILQGYLEDNNLDFTVDNLEAAFMATESQLASAAAKAVEPAVQEIVPAVDNTPSPVQPAEPVVVPVAPAVPPAAAPNAPAPARRLPDGGLIPGQTLTGRPTVTKPVGLTKADIKNMPTEEYKRRLTHEKGFREKVNALFAGK